MISAMLGPRRGVRSAPPACRRNAPNSSPAQRRSGPRRIRRSTQLNSPEPANSGTGARRREVEDEIEMAALAWPGTSGVSGFSPMRKRERGEESGAISLNQSRGVVNTVDFASRRGQTGRTRAAGLGRPCRVRLQAGLGHPRRREFKPAKLHLREPAVEH
jgi:hypothetical protein